MLKLKGNSAVYFFNLLRKMLPAFLRFGYSVGKLDIGLGKTVSLVYTIVYGPLSCVLFRQYEQFVYRTIDVTPLTCAVVST